MSSFVSLAMPVLVLTTYGIQQTFGAGTFNSNLGDAVVAALAKKMSVGKNFRGTIEFWCAQPNRKIFSDVYRVYWGSYIGDGSSSWVTDVRYSHGYLEDAQSVCTDANLAAWPKPSGWAAQLKPAECKKHVENMLSSGCGTMHNDQMDDMSPIRALFDSTATIKKGDVAP